MQPKVVKFGKVASINIGLQQQKKRKLNSIHNAREEAISLPISSNISDDVANSSSVSADEINSIKQFLHDMDNLSTTSAESENLCERLAEEDCSNIGTPLWSCNGQQVCKFTTTDIAKLLIQFQISHKASDSLMDNLCSILRRVLPSENDMPRNLAALRELLCSVANSSDSTNATNFFCTGCHCSIDHQFCHECSIATINQYGYFPILPQLKQIISNNYIDIINYMAKTASTQCDNGAYGDCVTGEKYKSYGENPDKDGILTLNLILSSDGAPITQQVNNSLWPLQAIVAELPPKLRSSLPNCLMFGMWLGQKPDWPTFLQPMLGMLERLKQPTSIKLSSGNEIKFRVRIFATIFDSVARASIWSVNQFNGKFGCTKCLNPGIPGSAVGGGRQQIYLPCDDDLKLKDQQFYDDAYEIRYKLEKIGNKEPYFGVKGEPILSKFGHIAQVDVLDTFHIIYEGVASYICRRLFLTDQTMAQKNCACYIGDKIDIPQIIIKGVQWPHDFQRTVRSLELIRHYKASEYKHLFYFLLPICTYNVFDDNDAYHFILLITEFIHILNMPIVMESQLEKAKRLLDVWLKLVHTYLDVNAFTFNIHSLIHLPDQLRQFGCTWSINASVFESWLGWMKQLRTGSTNALNVIMRRFIDYKATLPKKKDFTATLTILPIGKSVFQKVGCALKYPRVRANGRLYHSEAWKRGKRNSSFISYNDNGKKFAKVRYYLFNDHSGEVFAAINPYENMECIGSFICCPTDDMLKMLYDEGLYGSLIGFGRIILCVTKRNPFDYNNYGCYCGWGGSGTPVDPIDECCQVHDNCYGECGEKGCWPKLTPYTFSCIAENRTAVCNHEMNTPCDSCACACDANAAHCFKKNDQYYHGKAVCKS